MAEQPFTTAARLKQITKLIFEAGYESFPKRTQIESLIKGDPGLRAWFRNQRSTCQLMKQAEFFFYREQRRRRRPMLARHT